MSSPASPEGGNLPASEPAPPASGSAEKADTLDAMLARAGIKRVLVIDDVFDTPTLGELGEENVAEFAQDLAQVKALHDEVRAFEVNPESGVLSEADIRKIWQHCLSNGSFAGKDSGFKTPFAQFAGGHVLFNDRLRRYADVFVLGSTLEAGGANVKSVGAQEVIPDGEIDLLFLDFLLSTRRPAKGQTEDQLAIDKLGECYRKYAKTPYVILISDHENVVASKRTRICREVGTLGGYFGFIHKDGLADKTMLFLKLAELGVGTGSTGHQEIRAFAQAIVKAMGAVTETFQDFVYSLELQDYVHLQAKCLAERHQPLGEYVHWLLQAKLEHLFANDATVAEKRSRVNPLNYKGLLPAPSGVSDALSDAFFCAQTEPFRNVENRPPRLGDVYIRGKEAFLVVNNSCDLFVSHDGTSRRPEPNMPVYLVEGVMDERHPHRETVLPNVTDGFLIGGKPHSITWNVQSGVRTRDYDEFVNSLKQSEDLVLAAQLRPLLAVAIQQQFMAHLGRVGVPVAPPVGRAGQVHLYFGYRTDKMISLGGPIKSAGMIRHEGETVLGRLTVSGAYAIRSLIGNMVASPNASGLGADAIRWLSEYSLEIGNALNRESLWLELVSEFTGTRGLLKPKAPTGPTSGSVDDLQSVCARLVKQSDGPSKFLWEALPLGIQQLLANHLDGKSKPEDVLEPLLLELKRITRESAIFEEQRFADVPLKQGLKDFALTRPVGTNLVGLNESLLKEVYGVRLTRARKVGSRPDLILGDPVALGEPLETTGSFLIVITPE